MHLGVAAVAADIDAEADLDRVPFLFWIIEGDMRDMTVGIEVGPEDQVRYDIG